MVRWQGQNLVNILTLSIQELKELYPELTIASIERRQREYKQKFKEVNMEKLPEGRSQEELEQLAKAFGEVGLEFTAEELSKADRAGFHVGYIKNSDGEIEYTKPLPHVEFGKRSGSHTVEPVVAANIAPSLARIPKRDHNIIFVISDAQIGYRRFDGELHPIHDEAAIKAALLLAQDLRPNVVVDNGDTTDFAELSKYPVDSDHFTGTLQPSLQRTHNMFAEFTAATPGAERVSVGSNHVKRLADFVLRNAFPLYNIKGANETYPALSYPGLLKLDQIGWNFIDGYGSAEYQYKPDLAFIHGTFAVSNGSTAAKLSKANYGRNIVQGHKHSMETHYHTDRQGRQFGAFVVGALCRRDGVVPSYHSSVNQFNQPVTSYENWQNGVMVIRDYDPKNPDFGTYQVDQVPIVNGVIHYNGKVYSGNG